MTNIICSSRHCASKFDWDSKVGRPTCFASDLASLASGNLFSQIWDDAADIGFVLVNPKTGSEAVFSVACEMKHNGEMCGWILSPVASTLTACPALIGVTIGVFND